METEYQESLGEAFEVQPRIGELLRQERLKHGLELSAIAAETRVPTRHLAAIEADAHDSLPALPYTIGFVKAFARAVGYDPEAAAAQFRAETNKTSHVPQTMPLEPLDEARVPSRQLVWGSSLAAIALIAGIVAYSLGAFNESPPPAPPATETMAQPDVGPARENVGNGEFDQPSDAAANSTATNAASPSSALSGPVVITAVEDAWLKIYDRATGESVKMGILKAGEGYEVPADHPGLMLWTGRAGALQISVGGRTLPPLGELTETVRDVSLAPADLEARTANVE